MFTATKQHLITFLKCGCTQRCIGCVSNYQTVPSSLRGIFISLNIIILFYIFDNNHINYIPYTFPLTTPLYRTWKKNFTNGLISFLKSCTSSFNCPWEVAVIVFFHLYTQSVYKTFLLTLIFSLLDFERSLGHLSCWGVDWTAPNIY